MPRPPLGWDDPSPACTGLPGEPTLRYPSRTAPGSRAETLPPDLSSESPQSFGPRCQSPVPLRPQGPTGTPRAVLLPLPGFGGFDSRLGSPRPHPYWADYALGCRAQEEVRAASAGVLGPAPQLGGDCVADFGEQGPWSRTMTSVAGAPFRAGREMDRDPPRLAPAGWRGCGLRDRCSCPLEALDCGSRVSPLVSPLSPLRG